MFKHLFNDKYIVDTKYGKQPYVNLDNAATTPPLMAVEEVVTAFLHTYGSVHRGSGAKSKLSTDWFEQSREVIKQFVGAKNNDYVLFTNNTTGAMNTLAHFFSFLQGKVAVSAIEHSASWLPWIKGEGENVLRTSLYRLSDMAVVNEQIQKEGAKQVLIYGLNTDGEFDLEDIERILKCNEIKAFILTASSNLTGYCPPIEKIGQLVHKYGAYYVVDACQYLQHHEIDMQAMGIDFLCASGHKFYAPYGGGFLIGQKQFFDAFLPYQIGGGNLPYITSDGRFLRNKNQLAHDPGTPNAVGAIAMAQALTTLKNIGLKQIEQYENNLAHYAFDQLSKIEKIKLFVSKERVNTLLPFIIESMSSTEVAERLNNDYGIGVRCGSFCVYQVVRELLKISKVEEAKIIQKVENGNTSNIPGIIRASLSFSNSIEDIDRFVNAVREITCCEN